MAAEFCFRATPALWAARAVRLGVWGLGLVLAVVLWGWQRAGVQPWAAFSRLGAGVVGVRG